MENGAEHCRRVEIGSRIADNDAPAKRFSTRPDHRHRLRMAILVHKEGVRLGLRDAPRHRHRFGRGGRFIEQRGVGDFQPRKVGDHRLEIQQRLETALADLRLVRRIGRVPRRVFEHIALNDRRQMRTVIALANQRNHRAVARADRAHFRQQFVLG